MARLNIVTTFTKMVWGKKEEENRELYFKGVSISTHCQTVVDDHGIT